MHRQFDKYDEQHFKIELFPAVVIGKNAYTYTVPEAKYFDDKTAKIAMSCVNPFIAIKFIEAVKTKNTIKLKTTNHAAAAFQNIKKLVESDQMKVLDMMYKNCEQPVRQKMQNCGSHGT